MKRAGVPDAPGWVDVPPQTGVPTLQRVGAQAGVPALQRVGAQAGVPALQRVGAQADVLALQRVGAQAGEDVPQLAVVGTLTGGRTGGRGRSTAGSGGRTGGRGSHE
jgi:hypothetical protein